MPVYDKALKKAWYNREQTVELVNFVSHLLQNVRHAHVNMRSVNLIWTFKLEGDPVSCDIQTAQDYL